MLGGVLVFDQRFVHVVGITFTALILTENLLVAVEIKKWHPIMFLSQVLTLLVYLAAIIALSSPALVDSTFDLQFILTTEFFWKTAGLTAVSTVPIWIWRVFAHYCAPRVATKLS